MLGATGSGTGAPPVCAQAGPAQAHVPSAVLSTATSVAILYEGREIVVPVVDRGPYHEGYSFDLTQASADALGFTGAGAIGYIRVGPAS